MAFLALGNAVLAVAAALWLRALVRARRGELPCTAGAFSWAAVALVVLVLFGVVVANVLALRALDHAFGRQLSPLLFIAWMLTMSAAAIVLGIALEKRHTNLHAVAWLRPSGPDELVFRAGSESRVVKLAPGSVRVVGLVEGVGGLRYVEYEILDGERAIALVVPFTRDAAPATDGAPWLHRSSGVVVQAGARLHRQLVPFCATPTPRPDAG